MLNLAVCLLLFTTPGAHRNLWIDQSHQDFQAGREYYPMPDDAVSLDETDRNLRTWEIGATWWSPARGGLRILEKDLDFDDNGWKDVILSDNTGTCELRIYWNEHGRFSRPTVLSTAPYGCAQGFHVADLNCDGFEDLLVGCGCFSRTSFIFWGTNDPHTFTPETIMTPYADYGAQEVVPFDVNRDGYLDLWITGDDELWVLYGPRFGYRQPDRVLSLPDAGRLMTQVFADVDYDGRLDAVMGVDNGPDVIIAHGPEFRRIEQLDAPQSFDVHVADLNRDGFLDLVCPTDGDDDIFWGSREGFSPERRQVLSGETEGLSAVADLNNDGILDVICCNIGSWTTGPSNLWFGPGFSRRQVLPGGMVLPADYNNDGWTDLLMWYYNPDARLYWNRNGRFDPNDYTPFPCVADDGITYDLGNVYDRSKEERFVSRVHDVLGAGPDQTDFMSDECRVKLGVYGNLPEGMRLKTQSRVSVDGRRWTRWSTPRGEPPPGAIAGGSLNCLGRYFQYRLIAALDHNRTTEFRVDSVKAFIRGDDEAAGVTEAGGEPLATDIRPCGSAFAVSLELRGRLVVYDAAGRVCADMNLQPGEHLVPVRASQGVYAGRLVTDHGVLTRKLVLSR